MGHLFFGTLPRTQKWREVIGLVEEGGSAGQVADATLDAVEDQYAGAAADPAVVHTVWLLAQLPDAARGAEFKEALGRLGLDASGDPLTSEVVAAFGRAVDAHLRTLDAPRSDLGEMARLAAMETLAKRLEPGPSLFGAQGGEVQENLRRIGTEKQFGSLAREFFGCLTERVLSSYINRELPLHTGAGLRFNTTDDQKSFQDAVAVHAQQAAKIVERFAGGWYSKARFERDLTPERTARFVGYAMKKMRGELRRGAH